MVETSVTVYEPAIPRTPEVLIKGVEQGIQLYPVCPVAPDLGKLTLANYVAPQFAQAATTGKR